MPRVSKKNQDAEGATLSVAKKPRAPSLYNLFMKDTLAQLKEDEPDLDHRARFVKAANMWKSSPRNPKAGASTDKPSSSDSDDGNDDEAEAGDESASGVEDEE